MTNKEIIAKLESKKYLLVHKNNDLYKILKVVYEHGNLEILPKDVLRGWFAEEQTDDITKILEIMYGEDSLVYFYDDEKKSKAYLQQKAERDQKILDEKISIELATTEVVEKLNEITQNREIPKNPKGRTRSKYSNLSYKQFEELIYLDYKLRKLIHEIGEFKQDQKISTDSTLMNMQYERELIENNIKLLEGINLNR